jgi:hypothetical protein
MCRKHEYDSSTVQGVREDMIDTDGATGHGFCWIMFGYPLMRCSSFFQTALLLFARQTKKSILTAGPKIIFPIICRRQRQIVQPFFFLHDVAYFRDTIELFQAKNSFLASLREYQSRGLNLTFNITVASSCRSNCTTAVSILRRQTIHTLTHHRHASEYELTRQNTSATFWGPQRAPQTTVRLCTVVARA